MGCHAAVIDLGPWIAGEWKINQVRQPAPVAAEIEDVTIEASGVVGISGVRLEHLPDRDLLFSRILYLTGELREEIHHLLVHA